MTVKNYNDDPLNPHAALAASTEMANNNLHDTALLFVEKALNLNPDVDTKAALLERFSISGFYSKLARRKLTGKQACEDLATDRMRSWHTKNLARQNSTYYASSSSDLMPSTKLKMVEFVPEFDYSPMNPSITAHNDSLWMIQRSVNYRICPDGSYDMRGDSAIRTTNYLLQLDDDLNIVAAEEILPPKNLPDPVYNLVIGWEDCRLFFWNGEPWCTATVRELNAEGYCEIVLSRIIKEHNGKRRFADYRVIRPNFCTRQHEKNWMPMVVDDKLYFVYSCDPVRIIDSNGNLISKKVTHFAADSFRGGGNLVSFNDGWLALIHESHGMPDNRRRYMHRFVWYDAIGRLCRYSPAFYLHSLGIEFSAGLAKHPTRPEIIASFGVHDKTSWLASFDENEIKKILKSADLVSDKMSFDLDTISWLSQQTNRALMDKDSVSTSIDILKKALLPLHTDAPKNWDNLIGLWHTVLNIDPHDAVMDVAATPESAFLPSLSAMGYKNLISINLTQNKTEIINGVTYMHGDCTQTQFSDGYFGFISCLSVIEHGVDLDKFFAESSRILKSGGYLFISTDYWFDSVDTRGQTAFGAPVKVFSARDIHELAKIAEKHNLHITGQIDLTCNQKVVNWIGMDYTFINILFVKK
jgi:hypothetical protein